MLKKTCEFSKISQKNPIAIFLLLALVIPQFNNTNAEADDDSSCVGRPNGWKYEDPLDCHGFYVCLEDRAFQSFCEHFEKFDEDTRMCVVGKCPPCKKCNTDCPAPSPAPTTTPETPSTTPTQPTPAPFDPSKMDCRNEKLGKLWQSISHCREYWQCRNRQKVRFSCPVGQWFDDRKKKCDLKENVDCPANVD
ncbi:uncharacterized protein LOC129919352 [Episyrphus balteatus]|uniref:uncharacterized protein LOC129919352 n=1 Tax=Episyrphus balteatus TaxID=286459 RepID=UPI0024863B96|nr:uncharacterized protein LOC129919352 [Episyrphus balteatus]